MFQSGHKSVRNADLCRMRFVERKPIRTADGSFSLELADGTETYHSRHGALQESQYVFIAQGLETRASQASLTVLEVGFGTGLNALLAWAWAEKHGVRVHFITLETYPLQEAEWSALSFDVEVAGQPNAFTRMHRADWNVPVALSDSFELEKRTDSWLTFAAEGVADLVFYDAFGPPTHPQMWTAHTLYRAARALKPGGALVTYCAKGVVRRRLQRAGLEVERLPGPPGKREMLRANQTDPVPPAPTRFNLRAYMLLLNETEDAVLVADEVIHGHAMTKFPGGGVEFGEGPEDAVLREALEELGQEVEITGHFYTTGFHQVSAFRATDQLVSIYYRVKLVKPQVFSTLEADAPGDAESPLQFRWVPLDRIASWPLTYIIDQKVGELVGA